MGNSSNSSGSKNINFVFLFLGIILALLIVRWIERSIDLTIYNYLDISKQNLKSNLFILFVLVVFLMLFLWYVNQTGQQSVEAGIVESLDV